MSARIARKKKNNMIRISEGSRKIRLEGDAEDLKAVSYKLRVRPKGFEHAPSFKAYVLTDGQDGWDGFISPLLFDRYNEKLAFALRGHKDAIIDVARKLKIAVDLSKCIKSPFAGISPDDIPDDIIQADFSLDEYQRESVAYWLRHGMGVNKIAVNGGKCLAYGTKVIMFDGSKKAVQDVVVGDRLMGPDSKPRRVLGLGRGVDAMYRIEQGNGENYACNEDHLLVLQTSGLRSSDGKRFSTGEERIISVARYLEIPVHKRKQLKGVKSPLIEFEPREVVLDPYFLGLWLGDGNSDDSAITTGDSEIRSFIYGLAASFGLKIKAEQGTGCETLHITKKSRKGPHKANAIKWALRQLLLIKNKHIPESYLANTSSVRRSLLAGLIDSDGHVKKNAVEFTFVNEQLSKDVTHLCRSLGLRAQLKPKNGTPYWRIWIKGDFSGIPVRVTKKQSLPVCRRELRYAINVVYTGIESYFGFTLDGDGKFLLGDFTITHNTAMFASVAAMIKRRYGDDGRILYVTQSERLVRQAYKEVTRFLPLLHITQYGGSKKDSTGKDMVIATVAMLWANQSDLRSQGWFDTFIAVLYDESHHVCSPTSSKLMNLIPAYFRLGASDTRRESDPAKMAKIRGLLGPIRYTVPVSTYIDIGRSAKPSIYIVENPSWKNRYSGIPHNAEPDTRAWALVGDEWKKGRYIGPVYQRDEDGQIVMTQTKELVGVDEMQSFDQQGVEETVKAAKWEYVQKPVTLDGYHSIQFDGDPEVYEVSSTYCLLERATDKAIVRFRERNQLIADWAKYYSEECGFPTVIVCTRTLHVLILESMVQKAIGESRVRILFSQHSSRERDEAFEWFRSTEGSVLITPLIKEGVSINEIRGGVIADYIGDWEVANQIIGRFIRKKQGENEAHITWFLDNQHSSLRRGSTRVLNKLKDMRRYQFYHPVTGPSSIKTATVYEKMGD